MKFSYLLKNTSIILSICILFQSCFSYKHIENDKIELSKKYKIELKNNKVFKGRIHKFSEDSISLTSKGITIKIPKENIEEIKKRKFSYLKTSLTTFAVAAISLLALFGISIDIFKKDFNPFRNIR